MEEELRDSEEKFRQLTESIHEVFWMTDPKRSRMFYVSPAYEEIWGRTCESLYERPRSFLDALHPEDRKDVINTFEKQAQGETTDVEYRIMRSDGSVRWIRSRGFPIRNKVGELYRTAGIAEDITERKKAEDLIRTQAEVTKNMAEGAFIVGLHDVIIRWASPKFEEMFGYEPGEMIGKHVSIVNAPTDLTPMERADEIMEVIRRTGEWHREVNNIKKDGTPFWCYASVSTFTHPEYGEVLLAVHTDITEHKQAEEALRESEERIHTVVSNAPVVLWSLDKEGVFTLSEGAALKTLGLRPGEVVGQSVFDVYRDVPQILEYSRRALAGDTVASIVEVGDLVFESHYSPIRDNSGQVTGMVGVSTDITERKQMEEELRESEERYRALLNLGGKVGEAVVMLQDTEQGSAIHIFVSDEWPRITGYSREELLSMSFFDLLHPEHREASLKRHKRKMSGEIISGLFEMPIIRKDGTEVPIELTSAYTTYKGERANVTFIRDITERKQAEEKEKQLQQEVYLSSRLAAIGELAAGVAHEINNPLTGILGFSERLLRKSIDEKVKHDLEIIHNEAQRAAKVVQNLLTFARRRKPTKEYADINDIVQKTLELRGYELKTSNIEVVTDLAPSLPKIIADFLQIQEVFLNIILNAEQAMTESNQGVKLIIKTQEMKSCIRISFTDDGPGIPAEHLDKLFDPFFSTRGERGGTGLGLSVCHGIVTEHGGRIYAKSSREEGTTFFVELPLATERG